MAKENNPYVLIADIRQGDFDLRAVNKDDPKYRQIVDSLKSGYPIMNPINVRPNTSPLGSDDKTKYVLVDGKHRLTAALEAGHEKIPVNVLDIPEDNVHFAQMIANMAKVETRPVQYSKQLHRILAMPKFQGLTKEEILVKLGLSKSPQWFDSQLRLNDLIPEIQELVETGKINISNAYCLAKLPGDEQLHWIDRATSNDPDFITDCNKKIADLKKEAKGHKPIDDPLTTAKNRPLGEIKQKFIEIEGNLNNPSLAADKKSYNLGYYEGLRFCIRIDQATLDSKNTEKAKREAEKQLLAEKRKAMMEALAAKSKELAVTSEEVENRMKANLFAQPASV